MAKTATKEQGNARKSATGSSTASKGETLAERLSRVKARAALAPGENVMDICLYRNRTDTPQVIYDDEGVKHKLPARGYTGKSIEQLERRQIDAKDLVTFAGGTIILTRRRGTPLVTANILELIDVVDYAQPDADEQEDVGLVNKDEDGEVRKP